MDVSFLSLLLDQSLAMWLLSIHPATHPSFYHSFDKYWIWSASPPPDIILDAGDIVANEIGK